MARRTAGSGRLRQGPRRGVDGHGPRALMARAEQQRFFVAAVDHWVGALVPVPGGVCHAPRTGPCSARSASRATRPTTTRRPRWPHRGGRTGGRGGLKRWRRRSSAGPGGFPDGGLVGERDRGPVRPLLRLPAGSATSSSGGRSPQRRFDQALSPAHAGALRPPGLRPLGPLRRPPRPWTSSWRPWRAVAEALGLNPVDLRHLPRRRLWPRSGPPNGRNRVDRLVLYAGGRTAGHRRRGHP